MDLEIKKDLASNWFELLQNAFCNDISFLEGDKNKFKSHTWKRNQNRDEGGGEYRILKNGKIFDKVGVNFSKVYGKFPKKFQKKIPGAQQDPRFWASGISVVMHMKNPTMPAMHFNTRYICTTKQWFGGGMDMTPSKKDDSEKKDFHQTLNKMCNRHNKGYYKSYKKWCDEYFYLPHRQETRGIGGIFFDYKKKNFEKDFKFVQDVGITFQMLFNKIIRKKIKKNGLLKIKKFNILRGEDMWNLI